MDEDELRRFLYKLEELVLDEERIVTYKFLSRLLGVHVNTAKQLLYTYLLQQQKLSPCVISATYLLAGCMKDGQYFVSITSEDDFRKTYSHFDKITSEHVYSIQKGKATGLIKSSQVLYAADSNLEPPKSYPIKLSIPIERKLREGSRKNSKENGVDSTTKQKSNENEMKDASKKSSPVKNGKENSRKASHISNFFSNQAQRKKAKSEDTDGGRRDTAKSESVQTNDPSGVEESDAKEISVEKEAFAEEMTVCPKVCDGKKVPGGKKSKTNKEKKKRKRILSDSEDSESDEELRDALLSTNTEVTENPGTRRIVDEEGDNQSTLLNKRKKKKTIDKTVLLQDGYMETIKEVIYETDSDSEASKMNEEEAGSSRGVSALRGSAPSKLLENERGKNAPQKNNPKKQSTLFSFFKKS